MEPLWRPALVLVLVLVLVKDVRCYILAPSAQMARSKGQSALLSAQTLFPLERAELQGSWSYTPTSTGGSTTTLVSFTKETTITEMPYRRRLRFVPPLSLLVHNLSRADEGVYRLKVNLEFHNHTGRMVTVERTVLLTVDEPVSAPLVQRSPSPELVVVEDEVNVTWSCSVLRGTRVRFSWLKDEVKVVPSPRRLLSPDNSSLVLSPVQRQDRGLYRCVVTNAVSSSRSSPAARLSVYYGPYDLAVRSAHGRWTGQVFTVGPGQLARFECQADSNPPNSCVWISKSPNGSRVIGEGPRLQLGPHRLAPAEEFVCRAVNNVTHKQQEAHFTLVVHTGVDRQMAGAGSSPPLTVLTVLSLLAVLVLLLLLLWKHRRRPDSEGRSLHSRSQTEQNRPHCSGDEDAAEDCDVYEFLSPPSRADSEQFPRQDPHCTIYEVIRHVPDLQDLQDLRAPRNVPDLHT